MKGKARVDCTLFEPTQRGTPLSISDSNELVNKRKRFVETDRISRHFASVLLEGMKIVKAASRGVSLHHCVTQT